jgi:redox-sensitive bicupin YhaK (pirin superfamily)
MKTKIFRAEERGHADYEWLQANYSFSFANYSNPDRQNFGALRVLNDDVIKGGTGFGEHPHQNMEIITIPLQGALKHKDSMSNTWITLETGEVQVMSAGTGIMHSERNNSANESINLFQIWIIPDEMSVAPAYDQMEFDPSERKNKLQTLVTSYTDDAAHHLKIHQDVRISRMDLDKGNTFNYKLKSPNHGVYLMLINGELGINELELKRRDAIGLWQGEQFSFEAKESSEILFIEVPMFF